MDKSNLTVMYDSTNHLLVIAKNDVVMTLNAEEIQTIVNKQMPHFNIWSRNE